MNPPSTLETPIEAPPASPEDSREWTPQANSVERRSTVVLGARIKRHWLDATVCVTKVSFLGPLAQAFSDLVSLARQKKAKNPPTVRLKASLALTLDGIIVVDKHLGLHPERPRAAIELYTAEGVDESDKDQLRKDIRQVLSRWNQDVLQGWAEHNGLAEVAERLQQAISIEHIDLQPIQQPLVSRENGAALGRPQYHLIARRLAEQLVGEVLFEGLPPVDLVIDPSNTSASIELMTPPVRSSVNRNVYSMSARLSVLTMPHSQDLFVKIAPVKRVWASAVPGSKPNAPPTVGLTIMVPEKPFLLAHAQQKAGKWTFSDDYEECLARSDRALPATVEDAVKQIQPDASGWWVGFPKLTTLFDRIGGRTVFEGDEYALFELVSGLLPGALEPKFDFRKVKSMKQTVSSKVTALRPSDVGAEADGEAPNAEAIPVSEGLREDMGRAGAALAEEDAAADEAPMEKSTDKAERVHRVAAHRQTNVATLRAVHRGKPVHLYVFGGEPTEQDIIKACAKQLFGDEVQVHLEALPAHVHGLKADLEHANKKSLERFEARVARWEAAFKQLPDDGGSRHIMICADRLIGRRIEDPVNYYAAIHAACKNADANVHHVLPIQQKKGQDDIAHFVHRVQSAMLDVFLAHSGVILGVPELVKQTIFSGGVMKGAAPKYIYGIQAVRSRARRRSAEDDVSFILYTRLPVETGIVEVQFGCRIGKQDAPRRWMKLNEALRWLGSQRQISSDEVWLRNQFEPITRAFLAELLKHDPNAVVLIDWDRLGSLWSSLSDEVLCQSSPDQLLLGKSNLAQACPGMTFVRLRSTRDTSMAVRCTVSQIYTGWRTTPTLQATDEVRRQMYVTTTPEILELHNEASDGALPLGRRHYLQVMRYRNTVQLMRGLSCYRTTWRMKEIGGQGAVKKNGPKRYKLVDLQPSKDDAALPSTMEVTLLTCPKGVDCDEIVRLVTGLRLRYAHYADWTALPAPLFFIAKMDDYIVRYTESEDEGSIDAPQTTETTDDALLPDAQETVDAIPVGDGAVPEGRNPYLDDVVLEIVEQLPQLNNVSAEAGTKNETVQQDGNVGRDSDPLAFMLIQGTTAPKDDGSRDRLSMAEELAPFDVSKRKVSQISVNPQDEAGAGQAPTNPLLAKAWRLAQDTPTLYKPSNHDLRRLYDEMMCGGVRVTVDLPFFVSVENIMPATAWPDHKAIKRFWLDQGRLGFRRSTQSAPTTAQFPQWSLQRLRIPQSANTLNGFRLLRGDNLFFNAVNEANKALVKDLAERGLNEPTPLPGFAINVPELGRWLAEREDDEKMAWLITAAAHYPVPCRSFELFKALDGKVLQPKTLAAIHYFIDACQVAIELAGMTLAQRRNVSISRKRDPKWEALWHHQEREKDQMESDAETPIRSLLDELEVVPASSNLKMSLAAPFTATPLASAVAAAVRPTSSAPAPEEISTKVKAALAEVDPKVLEQHHLQTTELLEALTTQLGELLPGTSLFEAAKKGVLDRLEELAGVHDAIVQAIAQGKAEAEASQTRAAKRLVLLEDFFGRVQSTLVAIPVDLLDEPVHAKGTAQSWLEATMQQSDEEFDAWLEQANAQLATVQAACQEVMSTNAQYKAVDNGTDERLHGLKGLELIKTKNRLHNAAMERLEHAHQSLIASLRNRPWCVSEGKTTLPDDGPSGGQRQPEAAAAAAQDAPRGPGTAAQLAPDNVESVNATAQAADVKAKMASEQEAGAAHPAHDRSAHGEPAPEAALTAAETDPAASLSAAVQPTAEAAQGVAETTPEPAAVEQAAQAPSTTDMPAPREEGSTVQVELDMEEPEEAAEGASSDLKTEVIKVGSEFDAEALDRQTEPLQRAVADRLWMLAQVGVQALGAGNPHPIVQQNAMTWSSMLGSLLTLSSPSGGEQVLDQGLRQWLEKNAESGVDSAHRAFAQSVGVLGAGLLPILFEGHDPDARWAVLTHVGNRLQEHKALKELCDHLQSLDASAFLLTRENLSASRVGPRKSLEAEIQRQRNRAADWLNDPVLFMNWPHPEWFEMHRGMFDDKHGMVIGKALQHIVRGADDNLAKMMSELRKYVEKTPGTLGDLRKRTGRKRALEGPMYDKLGLNLAETIRFIEGYLELSKRMKNFAQADVPRNLREFLDLLYQRVEAAQAYLKEMAGSLGDDLKYEGATRMHLMLAQQVMQATLDLMNESPPEVKIGPEEQMLLMEGPMSVNMRPALSVRLDEDETPAILRDPMAVVEEVGSVQETLKEAQSEHGRSRTLDGLLETAADAHRAAGEILAARAIEQRMRLNGNVALTTQMQSANEAAARKQRNLLQDELAEARQRVTNALSVGAMTQTQANRCLKVIEMLVRANAENNIGRIGAPPSPHEDYPQARAVLRHLVLDPLDRRISESMLQLKGRMAEYAAELRSTVSDAAEQTRKLEQLERIEAMLKQGTPTSIRVAHNTFSLLIDNKLPVHKVSVDMSPAEAYELFQKDLSGFNAGRTPLESLRDVLLGKAQPKSVPAWLAAMDGDQRSEAAAFLESWISLAEASSISQVQEPLVAFFKGVGTAEAPAAYSEPGHSARLPFIVAPKTFVGSAKLQGVFIPPILGSASRDLRGVVLKHRPSTETFAQVIEELPVTSASLLLGRQRLTLAKRSAITREHPVLILDDDLVAYMAVHPGQRVARLMEVGLLTFHDNPYDDYGGPVPREMFFGRQQELSRLAQNKSAMVLYGGRRLGKSSLLDRIQNESRTKLVKVGNEWRGEVAIYVPLDSKMDSAIFGDDYKLFAWRGIYKGMLANDFIVPAKGDLSTSDAIRNYVFQEIMAGRSLTSQCYLLIDEADDVMRMDLEKGALFATGLRALCDDVRDKCQIRYVIAGLHNLTRMHNEGNTTLAKVDSMALQPFSSSADISNGIELITEPLAALGFVFPKGSENLPLRILAMCNFYPAFVQLYCKNLIQDLYNKRAGKAPCTPIEAADLERVENNKDFLGEMQKKFAYNLDLDKRYKAIALILADSYYAGTGGGVDHGMTATEIRNDCQDFFPNHFKNIGEGACTALLEEMEKLTVIERRGSRYQLRTPHIATMMGSRDDVNHMIDELARETSAQDRVPGESRLVMTRNNGHEELVFPMSSAWVRQLLHGEERDLVVLVGNHLSGLTEIEKAKGEWGFSQDGVYEVKLFSNSDNARTYINRVRRGSASQPEHRIIAMPSRNWGIAALDEFTALSSSLARPILALDNATPRQRTTNVRLMMLANPEQAWEIAQHLQGLDLLGHGVAQGVQAGKSRWRVEAVPNWGSDALYFRLKQVENQLLQDNGDACRALLEATCGFGGEILKLRRQGLTVEEVNKVRVEAPAKLTPSKDAFYTAIGLPEAVRQTVMPGAELMLTLIDGAKRDQAVIKEVAEGCGVAPAVFAYLQWMGLLQAGDENSWQVPVLYQQLIAQDKAEDKKKGTS